MLKVQKRTWPLEKEGELNRAKSDLIAAAAENEERDEIIAEILYEVTILGFEIE